MNDSSDSCSYLPHYNIQVHDSFGQIIRPLRIVIVEFGIALYPTTTQLQYGKPVLLSHLHELRCQCWEEGLVPQDVRDATIIMLYKNNGVCSDCEIYRGISLLIITGKIFARMHGSEEAADTI